jgi:peptidoglycan hydrolase CwlO-like protein
MVWAFIFGCLGAIAYIAYLVLEHIRESSLVGEQIGRHRQMIREAETKVGQAETARDEARAQCGQLEQDVGALQKSVDEVQAVIKERKKQMAQRGRYRVG